jgi:hypothetical protein
MGATMALSESPEPIDPRLLYPLPTLQRVAGLGVGAIRKMRREGLPVRYVAGRAYVAGEDFARFVMEHGKPEKDA